MFPNKRPVLLLKFRKWIIKGPNLQDDKLGALVPAPAPGATILRDKILPNASAGPNPPIDPVPLIHQPLPPNPLQLSNLASVFTLI